MCLHPTERFDVTQDAERILSASYRTGERFCAVHLVYIVRGARTEKAVRFVHDGLPTFGVGEDGSANAWCSVVHLMVAAGHLCIDIAGYGGLGITDKGRDLLRGNSAFLCCEDTAVAIGPEREPTVPDHDRSQAECSSRQI